MPSADRDGVALHYTLTEGRAPAIVLLHGWCCDRSYLAPQAEYFGGKGRQILALDLRGHGASDKPVQTYSMSGFADDVVWLCDRLQLQPAVLIGHSMGGLVAYDMARRHADRVSALVMLDSSIVLPAATRAAMPAFLERLRGAGFAEALRSYVRGNLMIPTDDPDRCERILSGMSAAPRHVAISAFEGLGLFDPGPAPAAIAAPALYVSADEAAARCDMAGLMRLLPALQLGRTVGSGHFCQLEVPDQVNAMIDRFLALAGL
jgi:pimeloyl-ACP methyl ester carboxylesterase